MNCYDFVFIILFAILSMSLMLQHIPYIKTKYSIALTKAFLFSILFFMYLNIMESTTEGFTQKHDDESFYQRAYNNCMRKNSPPFMGSVSDTTNYCLNNISNRLE